MGLMKIKEIKKIEYSGDVYNLHIENNHNYFADNMLVANCHMATGVSLTKILENCVNAKFRLGFTGTLKDCKISALQLTGIFGTVKNIISTKELMDAGYASKLKIKCIVLKYPEEIRKLVSTMDYNQELDTIVGYKKRNIFLANLADKLDGNTLTLIRFVEKHAKVLKEYYDAKENKITYLLTGETDKDEKMFVKDHLETVTNTNLMGSYGLLSTGVSIVNLNNLIFASPSKSKIRVLQSIGRLLRKGANKTEATIYDIVDDLRFEGKPNYMLRHFSDRYGYYKNEQFDVEIIHINIV